MDTVIGLDPSLTGSCVCRFSSGGVSFAISGDKKPASTWRDRMERYRGIATDVAMNIGHTKFPVFIEAYSMGSNNTRAFQTGEFGCYLRMKLGQSFGVDIIEVPPKELKKFVVGNGNANKPQMVSAVALILGRSLQCDDEADAYGLAWIGRCCLGIEEPSNAKRRDIVKAIRERHEEAFAQYPLA